MYSINDSNFPSVLPRLQASHSACGPVAAKLPTAVHERQCRDTQSTGNVYTCFVNFTSVCFPNPWRRILVPSTHVMHYTVSVWASNDNQASYHEICLPFYLTLDVRTVKQLEKQTWYVICSENNISILRYIPDFIQTYSDRLKIYKYVRKVFFFAADMKANCSEQNVSKHLPNLVCT
jgi:hypothetical protein